MPYPAYTIARMTHTIKRIRKVAFLFRGLGASVQSLDVCGIQLQSFVTVSNDLIALSKVSITSRAIGIENRVWLEEDGLCIVVNSILVLFAAKERVSLGLQRSCSLSSGLYPCNSPVSTIISTKMTTYTALTPALTYLRGKVSNGLWAHGSPFASSGCFGSLFYNFIMVSTDSRQHKGDGNSVYQSKQQLCLCQRVLLFLSSWKQASLTSWTTMSHKSSNRRLHQQLQHRRKQQHRTSSPCLQKTS